MPVEIVVAVIAVLAIISVSFQACWSSYRQQVPHPQVLLGLETRENVIGVTTYHLGTLRIPECHVLFLLFDLWMLRRKEKGNLVEDSRYVGKYNCPVSQEEMDRHFKRLEHTCLEETQGRMRRARDINHKHAPYVYQSRTFRLKSSPSRAEYQTMSSA